MERKRNVDGMRAVALLLVLFYHCWVLMGSAPINLPVASVLIPLGGEVGVTTFFVLSGFGIAFSLRTQEDKGKLAIGHFLRKRAKKILPQYYFSIIIALLFTEAAIYLDKQHMSNIFAHVLLVHNFSVKCHGAINGVLWTMGLTFQFYLIAIPLYYVLKKSNFTGIFGSIFITVLCKYIIYQIVYSFHVEQYIFIYSRQLISCLDNFVIGMGIALCYKQKKLKTSWKAVIGIIVGAFFLYIICRWGLNGGVYVNNYSGYIWHSILAICIGIILFSLCCIPDINSIISDIWEFLSRYEYGIYLYHLLIIQNLIQRIGWIQNAINNQNWFGCYTVLIGVSIIWGVIITHVLIKEK